VSGLWAREARLGLPARRGRGGRGGALTDRAGGFVFGGGGTNGGSSTFLRVRSNTCYKYFCRQLASQVDELVHPRLITEVDRPRVQKLDCLSLNMSICR
jgi:hypothetical protein